MDFKRLIYKYDNATNTTRISKTKVISLVVFFIFFFWDLLSIISDPKPGSNVILGPILMGLIVATPVFIVGFIISKIFNRNIFREIAAKKTTNEEKLINIAKNDSDAWVRSNAVANPILKNQSVLIDIAKNDSDSDVRLNAVKKITNEAVLIDIAKNDPNEWVRSNAVANPILKNQSVLIDIAKNDSDGIVREKSLRNINDEAVLIDIAKNDSSESVRMEAARIINDEAVLIDIAKNDPNEWVRKQALEKITDEAVLIDIARYDSDAWVRRDAFERITDKVVLADIAKNYNQEDLKVLATKTGKEHRCGACNKLVSPHVTKCPHCGVFLRGEKFKGYKRI